MTATRVAQGLTDSTRVLHFKFDGQRYTGFAGDTLASALLANGVRIVGRGFKYHRPRGLWSSWIDEPNAIFDVTLNDVRYPNVNAATTQLEDGMDARAVNAWPSARFDVKSVLDLLHPVLGAGFYYKTFMWPDWHLFEPSIRRMAGLGTLTGDVPDSYTSDQSYAQCDVLVVGGGPSGLAAARVLAEAGRDVVLVEDHPALGGTLHAFGGIIEGHTIHQWIENQHQAIKAAGGRVMIRTTAFGVYDHDCISLSTQANLGTAPRLTRLRARRVILASGAIDRPVTFINNDRPGVMSLLGALDFLGRYGIRLGTEMTILANHSHVATATGRLRDAAVTVRHLDPALHHTEAIGRRGVHAVSYGNEQHRCDALLSSAGLMPLVHLWCHAAGKLRWCTDRICFIPDKAPPHIDMRAIGGANGTFDLEPALSEARSVLKTESASETGKRTYSLTPVPVRTVTYGRQWIDVQHDVTLKDIDTAATEGFQSVEHLKRYTTLGMAVDQGKTSNVAGLSALSSTLDKPIPEIGTTTYRPPYVPQPLALYKPAERGALYHPLKRLALEDAHRASGAALSSYGGWLRPGWYDPAFAEHAEQGRSETAPSSPENRRDQEAKTARETVGLFDGSPLGKIEVIGPDAAAFVNFMFYNRLDNLAPGKLRYALMLTESGTVYDDGVVARLAENHYLISCSSSHVDGVLQMLETWRQDGHNPDRIFIHDATQSYVTLTLTGPKARHALASLKLPLGISQDAFAHMTFQDTVFDGKPLRISRVSFTGDLSFELSAPISSGVTLWKACVKAVLHQGGGLLGLEAVSLLRAEKGYIIVGTDTDGETMPQDLGMTGPLRNKRAPFVGDRALTSPAAEAKTRQQFVGLQVAEGEPALPVGAHLVEGTPRKSIGFVTSSFDSPTLGHPIALALLKNGRERMGEAVKVWHMGALREAIVSAPDAIDPEGARLNAE